MDFAKAIAIIIAGELSLSMIHTLMAVSPALQTGIYTVAQFIRICRWLKLIYKEQLAPLENAPFSVQWARKRCRVAQRFRQYLRATNCYKLSVQFSIGQCQNEQAVFDWAMSMDGKDAALGHFR